MPLETPKLDDRSFQALLDDVRRLIPRYCPQWTDHNLSDPGITLLELFATLVDTMIYRLNRVPEKNYITFMNLMGIQLEEPKAAHAPLTFWLVKELRNPKDDLVNIPKGTEVAVDQSGITKTPISFSTEHHLTLGPPDPITCLTSIDDQTFEDHGEWFDPDNKRSSPVFREKPEPGDSFYIVDKNDLSGHILELIISSPRRGLGIKPDEAPLVWEAWCGDLKNPWHEAEIESDETSGLNQEAGRLVLHLPQSMVSREKLVGGNKIQGYWVRCRCTESRKGQEPYTNSPEIRTIRMATLGGTVEAAHSTSIYNEIIGRSDGLPGQRFQLEYTPILPRVEGETVEVQSPDGKWITWVERPNFAKSKDDSTDKNSKNSSVTDNNTKDDDPQKSKRHFVLDSVSGEISFGPLIREPDGREHQYGAIPPAGCQIRFTHYRTGGGAIGNKVGTNKLTVLKSSAPYVKAVTNRKSAEGGLDAETLDRAKLRAPQKLRTSSRAVTAEDFEYLAIAWFDDYTDDDDATRRREWSNQKIKRAKCIPPLDKTESIITVLLVPAVEPAHERIDIRELILDEETKDKKATKDTVEKYLNKRCLLTTKSKVGTPKYIEVVVEATLKKVVEADSETVKSGAESRLYKFLNPLVGGPGADGWPFGRALYISEVFALLQTVPGIEYIEDLKLKVSEPRHPKDIAKQLKEIDVAKQKKIDVPEDSLIISGEHKITFG